jgi:hypothetical protein
MTRREFEEAKEALQVQSVADWAMSWNIADARAIRDEILWDWQKTVKNRAEDLNKLFDDFEIRASDVVEHDTSDLEPVSAFLDQCCITIKNPLDISSRQLSAASVSEADLFTCYEAWSKFTGQGQKLSLSSFRSRLANKMPGFRVKGYMSRDKEDGVMYIPVHYLGITIAPNVLRDGQVQPNYIGQYEGMSEIRELTDLHFVKGKNLVRKEQKT